MKSRVQNLMWFVRIVGVIVLTFGMIGTSSPVLAATGPDLAISVVHVGGDFAEGEQYRSYTITVKNVGDTATSGTITVTDTVPAGLTPWDISGSGWSCPAQPLSAAPTTLTCTRATSLAADAISTITFITDVDVNAGVGVLIDENPVYLRTVTNSVAVSGGGDTGVDPNDSASEDTRVIQKPDLVITGYKFMNEGRTSEIFSFEPDTSFWVRMTVKNRGGLATGLFYPSVFLDNKPNYGVDHAIFGQTTSFSDFKMAPAGAFNGVAEGALYYDPTGAINPLTTMVDTERGNYTRASYNDSIDPNTSVDVDVHIAYPASETEFNNPQWDPYRNGLPKGSYSFTLYADPDGSGGPVESFEDNNSLGPIYLSVGGVSSGPTNITVKIAGTTKGTYPMVPSTSMVAKYLVDGGPVEFSSNNGVGFVASLNQWRRNAASPASWFTGVSQSMALPVGLITNQYVMPLYNGTDPTLYNSVLMANVDSVPRTITVTIGGKLMGTYPLAPSASVNAVYSVKDGPIVVSSDAGAKIIASLYELKRSTAGVSWNGQSEMMGLPSGQLSDKYVLPLYFGAANPSTLDARLYIGNVDAIDTTVEVKIAGVSRGTYLLKKNTAMIAKYLIDGGPVEISSNNGAKIVVSLNQWRRNAASPEGWFTGVSQSMALPVGLITNQYVMPLYNGTDPTLYNAVLMANVDNVPRTITVTIGGKLMGTYPLAPSASVNAVYAVKDGPIIVSSDVGAKIIASLYELKRSTAGVSWNDQMEMMGLPWELLSDKYVLPLYFGAANPSTLDARLYIGVP